ncbi:MAG: efflux transporter outer membrane subunit [Rudaea sp.]|uniref:efflux transporter outer membrane subunit n=1 Tax=unclassified Rudaea TaxID=2627037 RepID=UPI0010F449DA|nr:MULTISPECIES: efflux transporter outer membrane subunit [unclassified Rudaea]MBN8885159.1 efflux transporter outer membrane subunit [Rudaea sp.]
MHQSIGKTCGAAARLVPLTVAAMLTACTVGPNYRGAPDIALGNGHDGRFVRAPDKDISTGPAPNEWWHALGDAQLDALIGDALAHNPNLAAAQARLQQARAQWQQQRAAKLPTVAGNAAAIRSRQPNLPASSDGSKPSSGLLGSGPVQLYSAGFDASWELDLFGGKRRATEAAAAQTESVEASLADAQVSLAAEVAAAYVGLRDEQQRLALAKQSADADEKLLELVRQRRARGVAADVDVERQNTQVQSAKSALIPLDEQIIESLDRLAVLTGKAPGDLDRELAAPAPLPALPENIAIGDPAALLRQRPDIRAAERQLAANTAQIGEHTADLFPKVSMLGYIGSAAGDPAHLARRHNMTWVGVPYLQWNLFDFGRTRAAIRGAEAARDEAAAKYTNSVLTALQDANGALSRYGHQRDSVERLALLRASADRSAALTSQRYAAGASSLIDLLDTQRTQFSAQQNLAQGQAELLRNFISLQKNLGLGWKSG